MSKYLDRELVADRASIVAAPRASHVVDRTFELPRRLYVATVALYLGFFAVMGAGLATAGLIIPMAIFVVFVAAGFGLPAIWTRLAPHDAAGNMSWARLARDGIATYTGRVTARDAMVQMLILPVLIFCWGVASVTIAALVR